MASSYVNGENEGKNVVEEKEENEDWRRMNIQKEGRKSSKRMREAEEKEEEECSGEMERKKRQKAGKEF